MQKNRMVTPYQVYRSTDPHPYNNTRDLSVEKWEYLIAQNAWDAYNYADHVILKDFPCHGIICRRIRYN